MGNITGKETDSDDEDEGVSSGSMHSNMLRQMKHNDVFKKYKTIEVLGSGSMGFVAKAKIRDKAVGGSAFKKKGLIVKRSSGSLSERRETEVLYALKSIILDRVSPMFLDELRNEIDILRSMDHPNIVKALEVYDNKKQIYVVLELCDGGDLYTRAPYSEKASASIVGKLLSAIKYMHDHGIVHRDLKFENVMFESRKEYAQIKVIDFGLSKKFFAGEQDIMKEGVGTLYTMAPQVLQGVYSSQADLWSVGVMTYMLLSSHRPFYNRRRKVMINNIMRADYNLSSVHWIPLSDEAKDIVKTLLVVDPSKRMNATEALQHKWLSKEFKLSDRKPDASVEDAVKASLESFRHTSELKKIALNVIAHKSSTDEILHLRKAFDQYDSTNDGIISFEEFKAALEQLHYSDETMKDIFKSVDVNKNGYIQYTEFLAATLEAQSYIEEERIAEAFDRLDSDDSGYISKKNLRQFLGNNTTSKQIDDIIREGDANGDGKLTYQEFLTMFRKKTVALKKTVVHEESDITDAGSDEDLLGLDAKIPGGRFDSSVDSELKNTPPTL